MDNFTSLAGPPDNHPNSDEPDDPHHIDWPEPQQEVGYDSRKSQLVAPKH